ncbi:GSCOCG00012522001-RA-CDS, partial [Cotesia congregata]
RFIILIIIFVSSIIIIIISINLIVILLGWDGLGLSSYCLVIYYQNKKSYNSGIITILINRVAAPTPVSSLVHSSTLVTAGIYLLIRFNYLFSIDFLLLIIIISRLTIFFSGISANFEFDFKKIIALSTLSQLGLIIFILRFKLPLISFFHLIIHAIFKSLLFLCSGIIIHNFFNNQDIRIISLNNNYIIFVNIVFYAASLTLIGIPFLTGFYSKDFIIEIFNIKYNNYFIFLILYISIGLTVSYSIRLIYYINLKILKNLNFLKFKLFNLINYSILILIFIIIFFGSIIN